MALKQELSQKFLQKLSPQQIQFIKLLQLNTQDFEEKVSQELLDNPALENLEGVDEGIDYRGGDERNNELQKEKSDESKDNYDAEDLNVNSDFDEYSQDINVDELLRAGGYSKIKLVALEVTSKTGTIPEAKLVLSVSGTEKPVTATGSGPVDATFRAIEAVANSGTTPP